MTAPPSSPDALAPHDFRVVEISREPIELYKILKFEGFAASGGEAKAVVAAGAVRVNGHCETQKRRKIVSGDTIEFNGQKIRITRSSAPDERPASTGGSVARDAQGSTQQ
jgi:ribosome-associated protein